MLTSAAAGWPPSSTTNRSPWVVVRFKVLYDTPNVKVQAYDVATNKPPTGAYRAPGGPQMFFAVEAQNHDRQIAADSVRPESGLGQPVERQNVRSGT